MNRALKLSIKKILLFCVCMTMLQLYDHRDAQEREKMKSFPPLIQYFYFIIRHYVYINLQKFLRITDLTLCECVCLHNVYFLKIFAHIGWENHCQQTPKCIYNSCIFVHNKKLIIDLISTEKCSVVNATQVDWSKYTRYSERSRILYISIVKCVC